MDYLIPAVILLFCAPAFFATGVLVRSIVILAGISLGLGVAALAWVHFLPADFFAQHPALADTPLHPVMAMLLGGILVRFGIGLFLALGARAVYRAMNVMKN